MDTFLVAVKTVLPLFLVILAGLIFSRTKVSSEHWVEILNKYALYIGFPALVVASLMHLETDGQSYSKLILYNSINVIVLMLLAFPIARIFRYSNKMKRSLILILPFANIAYLGIPILQNAFGDEILPAAAIISAVYIFWLFTLGIVFIEALDDRNIDFKNLLIRLVQNPLLISVLVGLIIVLFKINVPEVAENTINLFATSATAVVLFSLGIFLGIQKIGNLKEWYRVAAFVGFTMVILPYVFFEILKLINFEDQLLKASVIDLAMPLGLTPYVISIQYKLESTLMARIVVLGTLLSVFIIPLWMVFLG